MKLFENWNRKKQETENCKDRLMFKERNIWFTRMGKNIGDEEDGKGDSFLRPVLVFKKFNKSVFLGIPLTSSDKNDKFHFPFQFLENKKSSAILSQIRLFDAKRLQNKKGVISIVDFEKLKEKLHKLMFEE